MAEIARQPFRLNEGPGSEEGITADSQHEIGDYVRQRFDIGQAVGRATQKKLSFQQAAYGAEIEAAGLQRDLAHRTATPEMRAALDAAIDRRMQAEDAVVRCESEVVELEARLQAIDRLVSSRTLSSSLLCRLSLKPS